MKNTSSVALASYALSLQTYAPITSRGAQAVALSGCQLIHTQLVALSVLWQAHVLDTAAWGKTAEHTRPSPKQRAPAVRACR